MIKIAVGGIYKHYGRNYVVTQYCSGWVYVISQGGWSSKIKETKFRRYFKLLKQHPTWQESVNSLLFRGEQDK